MMTTALLQTTLNNESQIGCGVAPSDILGSKYVMKASNATRQGSQYHEKVQVATTQDQTAKPCKLTLLPKSLHPSRGGRQRACQANTNRGEQAERSSWVHRNRGTIFHP